MVAGKVFHNDACALGGTMKKALIGFLAGGILGALAGAGGMLLAFPFLFPPAEVNETVAAIAGRDVAALVETRFREGVAGQDARTGDAAACAPTAASTATC